MGSLKLFFVPVLWVLLQPFSVWAVNDNKHNTVRLEKLPQLVVSERAGVQEGVSAAYAGVAGDVLIVAGGCNFPDMAAAEGGRKVYYDDIYVLEHPLDKGASWKKAGTLPYRAAYGVSVTTPYGVVCVGGNNAERSLNEAWILKWSPEKSLVVTEFLPALPVAMDNLTGGASGNKMYVAGGNIDGVPGNRCFVLSLDRLAAGAAVWEELPPFPGSPRVQPAGGVQNGAEEARFYVMGGFLPARNGEAGKVLTDGVYYSPRDNQWYPAADMLPAGEQKHMALVGASGVASGSHHLVFIGGVNGEKFETALNAPLRIQQALAAGDDSLAGQIRMESGRYMDYPADWYAFNSQLLIYHTLTDAWVTEADFSELARAGAAVVPYRGKWLVVNGEAKPGIRSADVSVVGMEMKADFGWINWTVLIIYLFAMLFLGYFFMRRSNSSDDFFKGGGRIPWWAAGISIYATMLSAITYMAIPAKAFATDWCYYPMQLSILLVAFPVIKYYLPFFRRLKVTSAYEYLERRFNYTTRFMASALFIVFMVARSALVLYLPSLALTTVTGIDIYICIMLMGVVTIVYCTMGGVEAVVWGDVIQGIILVGGAFLAAGFLIFNTDGGFAGYVDIAMDNDKFKMFNWSFDYTKATFWVVILGGLANNLISYTSDQTVIQRYLTTKDERGAGRSILMNGIMSVVISIAFYAIGTGLYTFFKSHPAELDYSLANGDAVFPFFMMSQLPVGLAGLLIAAIFAATMSTIASNVNSTSTAFSVDIYKYFRPHIQDRQMLSVARWSSVGFGLLGTALAILMATWNILSLFDYFNTILGLLSSGLGGLFIMGIFFDRIEAKGALIGFLTGTVVVFLLSIYTSTSFLLFGAAGIVVSVSTGLIVSLFIRRKKDLAGLTWNGIKTEQV